MGRKGVCVKFSHEDSKPERQPVGLPKAKSFAEDRQTILDRFPAGLDSRPIRGNMTIIIKDDDGNYHTAGKIKNIANLCKQLYDMDNEDGSDKTDGQRRLSLIGTAGIPIFRHVEDTDSDGAEYSISKKLLSNAVYSRSCLFTSYREHAGLFHFRNEY